jgi:GNAT superfamily N-acetyltransferase
MQAAPDHSVLIADAQDAESIFGVLTLAFAADPPNRWMFPDAADYLRHFPGFARALGGNAIAARSAYVDADHSGVALWLAPDTGPDEAALTRFIADSVPAEKQADLAAVIEQMGRTHPAEPHWYLPFVGVEPVRQGLGLGAALLRPVLAACDADGVPAYLESTNPRNQPFYRRLGFAALAEIRVGDCPPIVPMLRRPGGQATAGHADRLGRR